MKLKLNNLKIDSIVFMNDTILIIIKYITLKQYKYILLNYKNWIKMYNLMQPVASHKTLKLFKLINELILSFKKY